MMYVHVEFLHSGGVLCTRLLLKRVDIKKWGSPDSVRTRSPETQVQGRRASAIGAETLAYNVTMNESKAYAVKESSSGVSANTGCSPYVYTLTMSAATKVLTDSSREYRSPHAKAIVAKDSACEMGAATRALQLQGTSCNTAGDTIKLSTTDSMKDESIPATTNSL
jgi:hypothetical protein